MPCCFVLLLPLTKVPLAHTNEAEESFCFIASTPSSIFCLLNSAQQTFECANTDRIQNFKRNLLIGFVEGLCPRTSHFSDLKEKMKNTFARTRVATSFRIPPLFGCYWYFKRINEDETALCLLQRTLDVYFFPHFTEALLSKQPINTKKFPIELH